ncbi:MAG: hypothetical protein K0R29_2473 [Pseudobdellovibrio sp.]|nr:hypothetical protein [Pseudobdellovibrio sp.]
MAVVVCGIVTIAYFRMHNTVDVAVHEVPEVEQTSANAVANQPKQKRGVASLPRIDANEYNACAHFIESDDEEENDVAAYNECIQQLQHTEISAEGVKFPYLNELSEVFTPDIEAKFDVFLVINTEDANGQRPNNGNIGVPRQHLRVLVKKHPGSNNPAHNVFRRNAQGEIVGINQNNINENVPALAGLNQVPKSIDGRYDRLGFSYLVPSTTGSANFKKTSNGVYLVNEVRSDNRQARYDEAPMSYQTYIDTHYASGQESGIAIHGTPSRNHGLLGVRRGSHGCARVHPHHAKIIRNYLETLSQRAVPKVNWQEWRSYQLQPSPLATQTVNRIPVLFVIFNGYEPSNVSFTFNKTFDVNIWNTYASN